MKQNIDKSTDWLDKFHQGQRLQRNAMSEIKSISRHLRYTFPHIDDDLIEITKMLEKAEKIMSKGMNQNMDEQLKSSQDFIGSALTGLLKAVEKDLE